MTKTQKASTVPQKPLDVEAVRKDFPILHQKVYGKPYVYLDNGATTQKPESVIEAISNFYRHANSSVHRGMHFFSEKATGAHENGRRVVKEFINAAHTHEIIFTRGTTESINLLAYTFGEKYVQQGDEIIVSQLEHHSNMVPWQMLCERKKARMVVLPMNDDGSLQAEKLPELLSARTRLVAVNHVSNALGTINPVEKIIQTAHQAGVPVLIDAAQSIQHSPTDVQALDCDFLAFSGHKIYGPTGIGVLYGKEKWLDALPPFHGGGEMIDQVTLEKTTFNELPFKFEAGTPNYVGTIGLSRALQYINNTGFEAIRRHEDQLLEYATQQLMAIEGLRIYGTSPQKTSVVSFLLDGAHPYDAGTLIDKMGIAVRTGHHCAQPVMDFFGIPGTIRATFAFYNNFNDIDRLTEAIRKAKQMLG